MIVAGVDALRRHVAADVASRASGRRVVVAPEDPVAGLAERHFVSVCVKSNAMFGLVIDLDLRVIRSHVALTAVLRRTRDIGLKAVARVAGVTRALGAVGIKPPHAAIRPGVGIDHRLVIFADAKNLSLIIPFKFDDAAVTLPTTVDGVGDIAGFASDALGQDIVEACEDLARLGVVALGKFLMLFGVAACAVFGRDQSRDQHAFMSPGVDVAFLRLVAIDAADAELSMARASPILHQCWGVGLVALDAARVGRRNHRF